MTPSRSIASLLACLLIAISPATVAAQGFEFGEEDVEEVPEDEGGMSFGEDDVDAVEEGGVYAEEEGATPMVAIVAVPGPHMEPDRRAEVQAEMSRVMEDVPGFIAVGPEAVLPGLEQRGKETCVSEPLCLAEVGREANVDRILVVRVVERPEGLELATDLFDVRDKLFMKYHTETGLSGTGGLVEAVRPSLYDVFDVRVRRGDPDYVGEEDTGVVQTVAAYGTAGLSVVALGLGIVFGLDASSIEDEVTSSPRNADGTYQMTQVQAQERLREADSAAVTANIFYGLAAGLAITSGILFFIDSGSDVASEEELRGGLQDLRLAPTVSADGMGVGASFRF